MTCLLCIGAGYSARAVADAVMAEGGTVIGTSRTPDGATRLAERGIDGLVFNGTSDLEPMRAAIARASHVLVSVAPDPGSGITDPTLVRLSADLAAANLDWVGYLSTVGVYGDHGGGWVDEESPLRPSSARAPNRIEAEQAWLGFGADYREDTGIRASTPVEQAYPLVFLCSDAAVGVNGVVLVTDAGYMSSGLTGAYPNATMIAKALSGRT